MFVRFEASAMWFEIRDLRFILLWQPSDLFLDLLCAVLVDVLSAT